MSTTNKALISWYKTKQGQKVAALERQMLQRIIEHFKPYRCLELANTPLTPEHLANKRVNVSRYFNKRITKGNTCVAADPTALPFASEFFDLVICCHVHEIGQSHGKIITELARVLSSGGMIVFIGVNPFGLWRALRSASLQQWWKKPITPSRLLEIADWCSLGEVYTDYSGFLQPGDMPKKQWEKHLSSMLVRYAPGLGALYKVVLRKNTASLTGLVDVATMQAAMPG